MKSRKNKPYIVVILIGLFVAGIGSSIWYIVDLRSEVSRLNTTLNETTNELDGLKNEIVSDPTSAVTKLQQEQNASILDEIAKVYALPGDENPTIATVQDITKLTDQPFFEGAENGDILVVFDQSSQALLFRPSSKKLVKVGPISVGDDVAGPATIEPTIAPPVEE